MANGAPVGLTVTTPEIAGGFQGSNIATFGGNPVTSVAAKATIELIEEENLLENADVVGNIFVASWKNCRPSIRLSATCAHGTDAGARTGQRRKTKEPAPELRRK